MKAPETHGRKALVLFLIGAFLFSSLIFSIFYQQNKKLRAEFNILIIEELFDYTVGQQAQAQGLIRSARSVLGNLAAVHAASGSPQDASWLPACSQALDGVHALYEIEFIPIEQLQTTLASGEIPESSRFFYERLQKGQGAVSDFLDEKQQEDKCFFLIAEPVIKEHTLIGAMQAKIDAASLIPVDHQTNLFQRVHSLIVTSDGTILFSNSSDYTSTATSNLYTSMTNSGILAENTALVQRLLYEPHLQVLQFEGKGKEYFVAKSQLGYHDWQVINFVRSPDVVLRSEVILKNIVLTGVLLILVTLAVVGFIVCLVFWQRKKLYLEQERYAVLSQFSDTILFEYDCQLDILEFTSNALQCLCLDCLQIEQLTKTEWMLQLVHPEDFGMVQGLFHTFCLDQEDSLSYIEIRLKQKQGEYGWFGCQYRWLFLSDGKPCRLIGKLVDITKQRSKEQLLLEQARRDVLTNTYNKAGEQIINELLPKVQCGIFFMLDLDDFKEVNDTYGHRAGDDFLIYVGRLLKQVFRADDIVARVGGDEFVVFIPNIDQFALAERKAQDLLQKLQIHFEEEHSPFAASASIGIAFYPQDGKNYHELYAAADYAMYKIKQQHKGGYGFYQQ